MKRFRFFFFYFFYSLLTATNGWMDQQQRFIQDLRPTDSIQLLFSLHIPASICCCCFDASLLVVVVVVVHLFSPILFQEIL
jgi:hypothetical protein